MFCDRAREYVSRSRAASFLVCQSVASHMESVAKSSAPWTDRTSHARQSINGKANVSGDMVNMQISHGVKYGRYLEQGTPAHDINLKNAKAFMWAGLPHPIRKSPIHHPGTKPMPAVLPAAKAGKEMLKQDILALWR